MAMGRTKCRRGEGEREIRGKSRSKEDQTGDDG